MDRTEKIVRIRELREKIKKKSELILQEQEELESLEERFKKKYVSELPILLFVINESLPMWDTERDLKFEYVYYFPDLDEIVYKYYNNYSNRIPLLPNAIDLRDSFKNFKMPNRLFPGSVQCDEKYNIIVRYAVSLLKGHIDHLFEKYEIESWADLGNLLTSENPDKGETKVLRQTNRQNQS